MEYPSLDQIRQNIARDIRVISGENNPARLKLANAIGEATAGSIFSMYAGLQWLERQLFPDTADGEHLIRAGKWRGYTLTPAAKAAGKATVKGTPNYLIPQGCEVRNAFGAIYAVSSSVQIGVDGTATVHLTALEAGTEGNYTGDLYTVSTISAIDSISSAVLTGGANEESIEALRQRVITSNQGGAYLYGKKGDYVSWAMAANVNVGRVWERPNIDNLGTLGVYVTGLNGPLQESTIAAIGDYINQRKPTEVNVEVIQAMLVTINFNCTVTPNTQDAQTITSGKISEYIYAKASPGGIIRPEEIEGYVIQNCPGITAFRVLNPSEDIKSAANELKVYGTVTYL